MSITYDRAKLYAAVRISVFGGHMSAIQVAGTNAILDVWEKHQPAGDTRFIAAMLGTANWETGHTMQPVREVGHGRDRDYGKPAGPYGQVYYGRGLVQLTWLDLYKRFDKILHQMGVLKADESLVRTPDLALHPDVAAAILLYGMLDGWFTGKKLSDYFSAHKTDWLNSRRIINGTDKAATVARICEHFYTGLTAARVAA